MISTDGARTVAHYPDRAPRSRRASATPTVCVPAAALEPAPARIRVAWRTRERVALTFSLADAGATNAAILAATDAAMAAGIGYTLTRTAGAWQGEPESGATLSVVGAEPATLRPVALALFDAGVEALQVEIQTASGYACEEWRRH